MKTITIILAAPFVLIGIPIGFIALALRSGFAAGELWFDRYTMPEALFVKMYEARKTIRNHARTERSEPSKP